MSASPAADLAAALAAAQPATERICAEVWALAELSFEEKASAAVHMRELEGAGFEIESVGTAGLPTAFVAEWRSGQDGPKVGFLAEYDALPGLGNAAVPRREPPADGGQNGHGCGHNMLGAALTGAAIATKHQMTADDVPGTLRVYGCAAEETEGAKVFMARDGLFDDLDAALHWHPGPDAAVLNFRLAATQLLRLEFHGRSAHAGLEPWSGRSALHALELAAHGINAMREHLEPTARVHYVFVEGGRAANVIPDYTRMSVIVRDVDRARVQATSEWVQQIAAGAALATQTEATTTAHFGMHDVLPNGPLARRMQVHLEQVGSPRWTGEEQDFARACQREAGVAEAGLCTEVTPLQDEPAIGGSSDVGDVELEHADDGDRDAHDAARRHAAHLAGHGLRRHVDRQPSDHCGVRGPRADRPRSAHRRRATRGRAQRLRATHRRPARTIRCLPPGRATPTAPLLRGLRQAR